MTIPCDCRPTCKAHLETIEKPLRIIVYDHAGVGVSCTLKLEDIEPLRKELLQMRRRATRAKERALRRD